jgi:hypothetical protein
MNPELKTSASAAGKMPGHPARRSKKPTLLEFPGLIAIGLYLLLFAGIITVDVVRGHVRPIYLIISVFFIAGALGLTLMLRWAWALTLAGVALLAGMFLWSFSAQHLYPNLVQGLLNLFFFLYLVRNDLRQQLR